MRRLALTDLDRQGRDLFITWCKEAGCSVKVDAVGNIFARRPGQDDSLPPTAPAATWTPNLRRQVRRQLRCAGRPGGDPHAQREPHPDPRADRGGGVDQRRGPALHAGDDGIGRVRRRVRAGHGVERADIDGTTVGEALNQIGYAGPEKAGGRPVGAYFEAHIEQGLILEDENKVLGGIVGALGLRWYDVAITGQDAHAGPTPMRLRKDALVAASKIVTEINALAYRYQPNGRGTVGFMQVKPNSRNVIPGEALPGGPAACRGRATRAHGAGDARGVRTLRRRSRTARPRRARRR